MAFLRIRLSCLILIGWKADSENVNTDLGRLDSAQRLGSSLIVTVFSVKNRQGYHLGIRGREAVGDLRREELI